jgi:subtilisin family serine protease
LIKYIYFGSATINEFNTNSSTIFGHANAAGAEAVGAAAYFNTPEFGVSSPVLNVYSSAGGTPILFDLAGNPVSDPRANKPGIVAPDCANTSFFVSGVDLEPDGFPNFCGTSAAAPHAAAVAALLRDLEPNLTPNQIYGILENTAIDMGSAGFDNDSGFGLIQSNAALVSGLGIGTKTAGLYSQVDGIFYLKNTNTAGGADLAFQFGPGGVGFEALVRDWNGDRVDTVGVYNPATGVFFLKSTNSAGLADVIFQFGPGSAGFIPLVGDWDGDGVDTVGVYNPATGFFFLKNTNSAGLADVTFQFGPGSAEFCPLVGDWDGQ